MFREKSREEEIKIRILSQEYEPEIKVLSEKPVDDEVEILDNEKDINAIYDERKQEVEDVIEKLFGAGVDDNSENTLLAHIRNSNQKISASEKSGTSPRLFLKEKMAILLAEENAKNEKERRDKIKALKK
jgi:hypothetical protein